jgi:hypothetical protein
MSELSCPGCGESEHLVGRRTRDGIEVTCETCGARWDRGAVRCRSCGGAASVTARQRMTRQPRGTLLAVVGMREVTLCPDCDRGPWTRCRRAAGRFPRGTSPGSSSARCPSDRRWPNPPDPLHPRVTVVVLGTMLGSSTRLSQVDDDQTAGALRAWLDRTWGAQAGPRRDHAVGTVRAALGYWRERAWLSRDLTADLE